MPFAAHDNLGFDQTRLARITPWMQSYVDAGKLPNAMMLLQHGGERVFYDAVGQADPETGRALQEDTLFRIYSMTKPITSVITLKLMEDAKLCLDDPVSKYIPEFEDTQVAIDPYEKPLRTEPVNEPVTIHHLLTHTAGLTYGLFGDDQVAAGYRRDKCDFGGQRGTLEEVAKRVAAQPLVFHPGEKWNYSVATDVLGRVLEVVSGLPLDQLFQREVFDPLGMTDTHFAVPPSKADRLASLYAYNSEKLMVLSDPANQDSRFVKDVSCYSGGGGLVSTLADYLKFAEMLRNEGRFKDGQLTSPLISPMSVHCMTQNHLPSDIADMGVSNFAETSFVGVGFGLGCWVYEDPGRAGVLTNVGEYGWGGVASTFFWVDPFADLTCIFMTQLAPSSTYPIRKEARALVYSSLIDSSPVS